MADQNNFFFFHKNGYTLKKPYPEPDSSSWLTYNGTCSHRFIYNKRVYIKYMYKKTTTNKRV